MTGSTLLPPVGRRAGHLALRQVLRAVPGPRELPTYFIIGAKRAGTTSLDEYLVDHPLVIRGLVEKGCRYYDVNFDKGPAWFRRHLPPRRVVDRLERRLGARPVVGESSPYYAFHPLALERIAAHVPDARLFFIIRDPVQRAWSHYRFEVALGYETLDLDEALRREPERLATGTEEERAFAHRHFGYLGRSSYAEQLEHVYRVFPREQLMVVDGDELFSSPREVMSRVFGHLGLPAHEQASYPAYKALTAATMPPGAAEWLREQLADDRRRLRDLLDVVPAWV